MTNEVWDYDQESYWILDGALLIVFVVAVMLIVVFPEWTGRTVGWVLGQFGQCFYYIADQAAIGFRGLR